MSTPIEMHCPHAQATVDFLQTAGLKVEAKPGASGFSDGVEIASGGLLVDPSAQASNILHEAGHCAIVPEQFRHLLNGDLMEGMQQIHQEMAALALHPDHPLERAVVQASDPEATAWAFAAGRAIGLADEVTIRDIDYDGEGEFIRQGLSLGAYIGINGLSHGGFCQLRPLPNRGLPIYPNLAFWLQPRISV
ncbi:hypothetical protein [Pseudomonas sp. EMN2]|uniref:hypothetical protein n=1 Tax=Pseudomonas sp. EMN2 TaxID=2615212 RepID=UPI002114DB5A|nr:hypothetical protein [Pseudomonas sp. EMN2]